MSCPVPTRGARGPTARKVKICILDQRGGETPHQTGFEKTECYEIPCARCKFQENRAETGRAGADADADADSDADADADAERRR